MKKAIVRISLAAILLAMPAVCIPSSITSQDCSWFGSQAILAPPPFNMSVYIVGSGYTSSNILLTTLAPSDTGTTFVDTPSDPGFNNFVSYLTNGVNDTLVVSLINPLNSSQFGTVPIDGFKLDFFGGSSLLNIGEITNVCLRVNNLVIEIPGLNLNQNGTNTDITGDIRMSINTYSSDSGPVFLLNGDGSRIAIVPEPDAFVLVAAGLILMTPVFWKKTFLQNFF